MKKEILDWLKFDRQFISGIQLYYRYGRNRVLIGQLNTQGNTKQNMDAMLDEFRQLIEMSISDFNGLILSPVKKKLREQPETEKQTVKVPEKETPKVQVPDNPKEKLRNEFPFLNDPDCPNELKVLVADKLTAYYLFLSGHDKLYTAQSNSDQFEAARQTVESWLENQSIYKELDYYKKHHEILGEHRFFFRLKRLKEISVLSTEELCVLRENIEHSIWRNNKLIEENKRPDLKQKRLEKIVEYQWELTEVNKIIDTRK